MDEVELHGDDEVEMIPVSPIRRMEKRLEAIERSTVSAGGSSGNFLVKEMLETMKGSQKLVDDIVIANHKLVDEIAKTNAKLSELVELIKAAGETEMGTSVDAFKPIADKLDKLIESNENLSTTIEDSMKKKVPTVPTKVRLPYPPIKRDLGGI